MEIEAKFRAPDDKTLRRIGDASDLAGYPVFAGRTQHLTDTYLDTDDWRVYAAGYTCRRRLSDDGILVTLKQLRDPDDAVHRREQFEVGLATDLPPSEWPDGDVRSKTLEMIEGRPLVEKLDLRQTRTNRWVGAIDRPVAELSLDEVHLEPSGTVYHEVEVELMEAGTEEDMAALVIALQNEWSLEPESQSKFERALAMSGEGPASETQTASDTDRKAAPEEEPNLVEAEPAAPTESAPQVEPAAEPTGGRALRRRFLGDGLEILSKPGIDADDTMAEAARKALLYHLQRMMKHEPGTREGEDPEELHDMRVATRRMRAALRVFGDYLDMGAYKPFLRVLRTAGRELGTVRDLDVFQIKTRLYIDSLAPEDQAGLDPLMEAWAKERERARTELIDFLDSGRYDRFKESFERFLRIPGVGTGPSVKDTGEPLPTRVCDVLPGVLFDRLASVRAFGELITQPDAPLTRFHELRITSKGLRYTLEFFQEVLGPESKPLIDTTKAVQDHLGDLQDAVVTCDVLLGFLGSGTWGPQRPAKKADRAPLPVNAPGVATYLAVKQREIESLMHSFGPVWERIGSPGFSRPLSQLVGVL